MALTMGKSVAGVAMKKIEENKGALRPVPVAERVGVEVSRYFTAKLAAGKTPYDEIRWEKRTAEIGRAHV